VADVISISMGSVLAVENKLLKMGPETLMVAIVSETTTATRFNDDNLPSKFPPEDPNPPAPVTVKVSGEVTGAASNEGITETMGDKTKRRVLEEFVDKNFRPNITNSISSVPLLGERTTASENPVEMVATIKMSCISTANECPLRDGPIRATDMSPPPPLLAHAPPPTAPKPKPAIDIFTTPDVAANTSDGMTADIGVAQSNDEETPALSVNVPLGHAIHVDIDIAF
jgi:hypothetical protein